MVLALVPRSLLPGIPWGVWSPCRARDLWLWDVFGVGSSVGSELGSGIGSGNNYGAGSEVGSGVGSGNGSGVGPGVGAGVGPSVSTALVRFWRRFRTVDNNNPNPNEFDILVFGTFRQFDILAL